MSLPGHRLPPIGSKGPAHRSRWRRLLHAWRLPRTLRVTPVGRTYLIVTLGVGMGALNTGNNLLYLVLGLLLSLIVVSGVLSERVLRGLHVRRLGAEAAFAGEPFAFRWALFREKGHAFALEISEVNPGLRGGGTIAHLPPGREQVVRGDLLAPRRGPHRLSQIRVTTQFPLGLFAKTRVFELDDTLLVYPRRVAAPRLSEHGADRADGTSASARTGGTGDVTELVPLREGDDARRIHWLRSATLGQWVRFDREREERRTFVLHAHGSAPSERLERHCENLAATARHLLSHGHEVGLEADDTKLRPSAGASQERRILRALTFVGFEPEAER